MHSLRFISVIELPRIPAFYPKKLYGTDFFFAVDVEGKASGIEEELVRLLGSWGKIPVTYAGGVGDFEDLARLKKLGKNMLNVTIGSALDIFGGTMSYEKVKEFCRE